MLRDMQNKLKRFNIDLTAVSEEYKKMRER